MRGGTRATGTGRGGPYGGREGPFGAPRRPPARRPPGPVWTVFGGGRGPVAGVMVVYGPPITHLPPPAVGASPDAAIHDFKGSCRRSSQCGGRRRSRPGAAEDGNAPALSGAGKRTAASGVAWSGCASLRGPLCAGEALLEARTQASVALFKLGAHSATLRPEFGGPKSLRCCCAKGVGHRAQLMLRARRGARENDYPVPLLRTPTPQKLSLSCPHSEHRGGSQLPSLSTSCHVADRERISSCSARRVAKAKVLPEPPGALTTWRRSRFDLYL